MRRAFEEFGEGFVGFAFEPHPLQFDGDELGFVDGNPLQSPGEIGEFGDVADVFERFRAVRWLSAA